MNEFIKSAVLSLSVFEITSPATRPVYAPGRDFHSLTYRHSGSVTIESDAVQLLSGPDHITYTPKGFSYRTEILEEMHMTAVHFTLEKDPGISIPHILPAKGTSLERLFRELLLNYKVGTSPDFSSMASFYQILAEIERINKTLNLSFIPQKITEAKSLIDQSFSAPDFSIAVLAETLKISDSYLRREFKKAFGLSPVSYLKNLRINNAKSLLDSNYYSIAQIARQCGFNSVSYFIQSFHTETGVTPLSYQSRHLT